MRTFPILTALALTLLAPSVLAQDKHGEDDPWYLQMGLGAVWVEPVDSPLGGGAEVDFDAGIFGSLALGRDLGTVGPLGVAVEAEGLYAYSTTDEADLVPFGTTEDGANLVAWMGNVVFDWQFGDEFAWYFGGGAGFATQAQFETFDNANFSQVDDNGFAAQLKTGLEYHLGGLIDFLIGYRFIATEDLEIRNNTNLSTFDVENFRHVLELGFRWGF
jgi:opacity protein-like surface antigen